MERFRRLDVIMPVNEHGGPSRHMRAPGQDRGVAAGYAHLGLEATFSEKGLEPLGAGQHVRCVVGFGRNAGKTEELE